jgi:hypothetical protein
MSNLKIGRGCVLVSIVGDALTTVVGSKDMHAHI